MEQFAYDLSQALSKQVSLVPVTWGGRGRARAVLVAVPSLTLRAFSKLLVYKFDLVHVNDGLMAPSGYLLAKLFRKRFVVVLHGLDITYRNPLFRLLVPAAVRRADHVFCISRATAEVAQAQGVSAAKLTVMPLAAEDTIYGRATRRDLLQLSGLTDEAQILLTVGRLEERKGVAWFIANVLPGLIQAYPRLQYVVVGEGAAQAAIEAAVTDQQLAGHVHLLGRLEAKQYQAAYNGADIFVMPNILVPGDIEGFGLVVLEAALCGLPVVAADIEGIRDAIRDNQNGYLVPSGDTAAFTAKLGDLLDNPKQAQQFGHQSRAYTLGNFRWQPLARRYVEVYKQLLQ